MEPVLSASLQHTGRILAIKTKMNPEQDLLSETINSISGYNYTPEYDNHNLKLLVKEIDDMKYKIQNMEKNKQLIVIPIEIRSTYEAESR